MLIKVSYGDKMSLGCWICWIITVGEFEMRANEAQTSEYKQ